VTTSCVQLNSASSDAVDGPIRDSTARLLSEANYRLEKPTLQKALSGYSSAKCERDRWTQATNVSPEFL